MNTPVQKLFSIITWVLLAASASAQNSVLSMTSWKIGNVTIPECFFLYDGPPPVPSPPPTPTYFNNDIADQSNGHHSYRLISNTDYPPDDWPWLNTFPPPVDPNFSDFSNGGEIRFSGFDLQLGGNTNRPLEILNDPVSGIWTLLTDNNINSYGSFPAVFNNAGIFRKAGGTGVSTINILFTNIGSAFDYNDGARGVIDVETGTLVLSGGFSSLFSLSVSGPGTLRINSDAYFTGVAKINPEATLEFAAGTYTNVSIFPTNATTGVTTVFDTNGFVEAAGTVIWSGGQFYGPVANRANFTLMPTNNTALLDTATFNNYGHFQGNGFVVATNGQFLNYGVVSPGTTNSPGILTFTGNYAQQSSGILQIGIAGRQTNQFAQLYVAGTNTEAGSLVVALVGGFVPSAGDTFNVINATTSTGSFSSNSLPSLPSGLFWRTDQLSTLGLLSVSSVPASNSVWLNYYFTASELANTNISGLNADPSHDGIINLFSYLLGLNPRVAYTNANSAILPSPVLTQNGSNTVLALQFSMPALPPADGFYQIQSVTSISDNSWTTIASKSGIGNWTGSAAVTVGSPTSGRVQVTVQDTQNITGSTTRFMRLEGSLLP
jgi:hypothetical protein